MAIQTWTCGACGVECSRVRIKGQVPKWCDDCRRRGQRGTQCSDCGVQISNKSTGRCLTCTMALRPRQPKPEPKPRRERTTWPTSRIHIAACRICGKAISSRYYNTQICSDDECARRNHRAITSSSRHRRRSLTGGEGSGVISWRSVREQQGPACYLCGYDTDDSDYTVRLGSDGREVFIVGLEYPSLDHVIPLSKGGEHSMSNARLAHTYCNSIKSDQVA